MKFSDSFLDEIRARLSVSQVVSRRVALRRRGREFVGLSPFNPEKTPSFTVNDQKGFYHCFSSGKHGDIFTFVMETEGLSFPEAVERLAREAGLPLPKPDPQAERASQERQSLRGAIEATAKFYEQALRDGMGAEARAYAERRGLKPETLQDFRIGYAPLAKDALKTALLKQGFSEAQLVEAGLLIKPEDGRSSYDRFRHRLMIPIPDIRGRIIGFGARALDPAAEPKYLNSPETRLFDKGNLVFNFAHARGPAFDKGELIVVEGYMDVIGLHQAGFRNVVATLGTAFTERQMEQLWQLAPEPIICFDGDRAGEAAAFRAIDRMLPALREGHSFRFVFLPKDTDPDDLVRHEGAGAFAACLAEAMPLIDAVWLRELRGKALDTPERRAAFERGIEQLLGTIANARVREHYRRALRERLWQLWRGQARLSAPVKRGGAGKIPLGNHGREVLLVLACATHPWLLVRFAERLSRLTLKHGRLAGAFAFLSDMLHKRPNALAEEIEAELRQSPHGPFLARLRQKSAFARVRFVRPDAEPDEVESQFAQFLTLWKDLPSLRKELEQAAEHLAHGSEADFERFAALQEQLAAIETQHPEDSKEQEALRRFQETVARLKAEQGGAGRRLPR